MNNNNNKANSTQSPQPPVAAGAKDSDEDFPTASSPLPEPLSAKIYEDSAFEDDVVMEFVPEKESAAGALSSADDTMDEDFMNPATVFCIKLNQQKSNLLHEMSVPELCRTFSSSSNPPFWIPIHIVIPERSTECTVFNVIAVHRVVPFIVPSSAADS